MIGDDFSLHWCKQKGKQGPRILSGSSQMSPHLLVCVETRAPRTIFSCVWLIITHWEGSSHTNQP